MPRLVAILVLLALPLPASAASIPLVFTLEDGSSQRVVMTLDDTIVVTREPGSPSSVLGSLGNLQYQGLTIPALPTPDGVGSQTGQSWMHNAFEERVGAFGGEPAFRRFGARWGHTDEFFVASLEGFGYYESLFLSGPKVPLQGPLGTPTTLSVLEALAWGGTVDLHFGWFYTVGGEDWTWSNTRHNTGTYALDEAAATVPEPASLLLVASGLAFLRRRK